MFMTDIIYIYACFQVDFLFVLHKEWVTIQQSQTKEIVILKRSLFQPKVNQWPVSAAV